MMLRNRRQVVGLTIEDLAERSGVSVRAIGNMERGISRSPQRRTLSEIADALGLDTQGRAAFVDAARSVRRQVVDQAPARCALPRGVPDFTGHDAERALLVAKLRADSVGAVVVSGQPGAGKTSIAVRTATDLLDDFPDGCYFVDLRGLSDRPPNPSWLMEKLVLAIDPMHNSLPAAVGERSALFCGLLATRRALIVLDNAADEAQVRPLLPDAGGSRIIVTSRRRLAGLDGARHLILEPMDVPDATRLLTVILEVADRPMKYTDLQEVAVLCAGLPLAIRIAANRIASHPDMPIADLLERLRDRTRRLAVLAVGDNQVQAAFDSSYELLSDSSRALFRRCALISGSDFGMSIAAQLVDKSIEVTEKLVDELVDLGLLQAGYSGRYRQHDLLRLFASARLLAEEDPATQDDTRIDLHRWLLRAAAAAAQHWSPDHPSGSSAAPAITATSEQARNWLLAERSNWEAAYDAAFAAGNHHEVTGFAHALDWFSSTFNGENWTDFFRTSTSAAHALGVPAIEAENLTMLASAHLNGDRDYPEILAILKRARALVEQTQDDRIASIVHRKTGWTYKRLSRFDLAEKHLLLAEAAARNAQAWAELIQTHEALGSMLAAIPGRTDDARRYSESASASAQNSAYNFPADFVRLAQLKTSIAIGDAWLTDCESELALVALNQAAQHIRPTDDRGWHAELDFSRGQALVETGSVSEGMALLHRALAFAAERRLESMRMEVTDKIAVYAIDHDH